MNLDKFFVSGIDTGVGKTLVSTVLTQALRADYWKPVQAGDLENSDSINVSKFITNDKTRIFEERYRLNTPCSPHLAARIDGVKISLSDFELPDTNNKLIVEGAGGLLVPINEKETILDLIKYLKLPVLIVSKNYLGSINHTLSSIEILKNHGVQILGIVFSGEENQETERIIEKLSDVNVVTRVPFISNITKATVADVASKLKLKI